MHVADAGYFSKDNVNAGEEHQIEPYINASREKHRPAPKELFRDPDPPPEYSAPLEAMNRRMQTEKEKAFYKTRESTVEPVLGIIKQALGFRQFLHRDLQKANGEWYLIKCAYNL